MTTMIIKKESFKRKDLLPHMAAMLIIVFIMVVFYYYTREQLLNGTIAENHIEGSLTETKRLKKGDVLEQELIVRNRQIVGMGIRIVGNGNNDANGEIYAEIRNAANNKLLNSTYVNINDKNADGYVYFGFKDIIDSKKDSTIILKMELTELSGGDYITLGLSGENTDSDERLYINAELQGRNIDLNFVILQRDMVYKVIKLLMPVMTVFLLLMYYVLVIKGRKTERVFLFALIFLEIVYMLMIIPNTVPDERTHEYGAYYVSSKILGKTAADDEGNLYMRKCDVNETVASSAPNRNQYNDFYGSLFKKADAAEIVHTENKPLYSIPVFNYVFSGAGIAAGRMLGFNQETVLFIGRIFNLIFYVAMCWYALKQLPFGKCLLMTIMLLPVALQQAMSFSYDVLLNSMSFALAAICLKFAYDRNNVKRHNYIMYVVLSVLIMQSKGGAYIPLVLLILLPIIIDIKKIKSSNKHLKQQREYVKRIKWLVLSMAAAFACFGIYKVINIVNKNPLIAEKNDNIIEWAGQPGYTIGYLLHNPLKIINIIGSTVYGQFDFHLRTFLGGELGWFKIQIPWFLVLMCLLCMLLAAVRVQGENEYFTKKSRLFIILLSALCMCMCYGGMLLEWTPATSEQILGVQGRYFIPFILPLLLTIRSNILTLNKNIDKYILFFMISVQPFILFCIERDAMCVNVI